MASNLNVGPAGVAPEQIGQSICAGRMAYGTHDGLSAVVDPAERALEIGPDKRVEIVKAMNRVKRRIKLRLYRDLLRLQLFKLVLECRLASMKARRTLSGDFVNALFRRGHPNPPRVGGGIISPRRDSP